jgi:hypothetical protein
MTGFGIACRRHSSWCNGLPYIHRRRESWDWPTTDELFDFKEDELNADQVSSVEINLTCPVLESHVSEVVLR